MVSASLLFVLPWLLQGARALPSVPSRTQPQGLQAPVAPAVPTSRLDSDFKKNNVSAQWAEGHPKLWGTVEKIYEMPVPLGQTVFDASLSPDQKFLVLSNSTDMRVIKLATGEIVSTPAHSSAEENGLVELRSAPGGQYDLIISSRYRSAVVMNKHKITQIRLSAEGIPVQAPIMRPGDLVADDPTQSSKDGRRILATYLFDGPVHVYDLDNATYDLALSGPDDQIANGAFSADGKYVVTTDRGGWTKIWDAHSGQLVQDFGSKTTGYSYLTKFSPDGKFLLISSGYPLPTAKLWSIENVPVEVADFAPPDVEIVKATWSPNGEYLAFCAYNRMIRVARMSDLTIVQEWLAQDYLSIEMLSWLEDGQLAWRVGGGLEVYDFEKNLKYRWGPDEFDHFTSSRKVFVSGDRKLIGGVDGDQKVRFWPYIV